MTPKAWAMTGIAATAAAQGFGLACLERVTPSVHANGVFMAAMAFLSGLFPFAWIMFDRKERGLPRSYGFNVGVVALGLVFIPAYLWRSRPRGRRLLAEFGLAGIVLGSALVSLFSAVTGLVLLAAFTGELQS